MCRAGLGVRNRFLSLTRTRGTLPHLPAEPDHDQGQERQRRGEADDRYQLVLRDVASAVVERPVVDVQLAVGALDALMAAQLGEDAVELAVGWTWLRDWFLPSLHHGRQDTPASGVAVPSVST